MRSFWIIFDILDPVLTSLSLIFSCNLPCTGVCTWVSLSVHAYDSTVSVIPYLYTSTVLTSCTTEVYVSLRFCETGPEHDGSVVTRHVLLPAWRNRDSCDCSRLIPAHLDSHRRVWSDPGPSSTLSFALLLFVNSLARSGSLGRTTSYCIF